MAQKALQEAGFVVDVAPDGSAAYDALKATAYDLLITDIMMPGLDGIELALLATQDRPGLPVILMSGLAAQRARAHNLDALVREVLAKPFSLAEIRDAARRALA
ncbi:MAG: response regulator [Alphaproteobacteria bacterium]|nr:response regulator [Alphaproteobacteria bacterium]